MRGTPLLPYRGVDGVEVRGKGMRVKLGGVFKYVASSFDSWGDDPILFDIFSDAQSKTSPRKMTCFSRIVCESLSMSLEKPGQDVCFFCENHTGNLDSRRIARMSEIPLTACLVLKETSYDI